MDTPKTPTTITPWNRNRLQSERTLTYEVPTTKAEVNQYIESQSWWGYHPAGYGGELKQIDELGKVWAYHRFNSCD